MFRKSLLLLALGLLVACASVPEYRSDFDRSADFASYRTYAFVKELGTDRGGYSSLVTLHFRRAVSREMEARGYVLNEANPDLLVNFNTSARERTEVHSSPGFYGGYYGGGYYGYRYGMYGAWPMYGYGGSDVYTEHYQVGTANVDVVDAKRKQLVWEGVVEGKITDKMLKDTGASINAIVAEIFLKYPATAGTPAVAPAK